MPANCHAHTHARTHAHTHKHSDTQTDHRHTKSQMQLLIILMAQLSLACVTANYLNGMTVFQGVKFKSTCEVRRCKLRPDVVLWKAVIHTQILDPRCETFIQPQVSPPFLQHNPPSDSCNPPTTYTTVKQREHLSIAKPLQNRQHAYTRTYPFYGRKRGGDGKRGEGRKWECKNENRNGMEVKAGKDEGKEEKSKH